VYAKKNLDHLKTMNTQASSGMKAFWDFDRAAFEEGALSAKAKQIIAVAVALTTQCPYCIDIHGAAARGRDRRGADGSGTCRRGDPRGRRDHARDTPVDGRRAAKVNRSRRKSCKSPISC
jgi:AhpD family alkylhydroperoxidase